MVSKKFCRAILPAGVAYGLFTVVAFGQIGGSGWSPAPVTFNVQWPYNVPENTRYWFTNNIYHCLVYSNDVPFKVGSTTLPRTEQRFTPDYTNGEIQYQSMIKADPTENSYCVFQIHTGDAQSAAFGSTTFMLFWFTSDGGSVHDYSGTELAKNLGSQWFQVNVDHNLVTRSIKVWINQKLVWTQQDNGAGDFYFKDGVYEQNHSPTLQMDTYITNILMWTSSGSNPPAAPTGLKATPGVGQFLLTWNAVVDASSYNVKRATNSGGPYTTLSADPTNNYVDGSVANGPTYYYAVSAVDQFGESVNSTEVSASLVSTNQPPKVAFNSIAVGASRSDLVFRGSGGSPLAPYYLRSSTELAVPLSQWQTNASNQLDAGGNFSLTVTGAVDPAVAKRFYRLQTQ